MIITARYPGSAKEPYTTYYNTETGESSCNCRGWTVKKGDRPRECKHTKDMHAKHGGGAAPSAPVAPVAHVCDVPAAMLATAMPEDKRLEDYMNGHYVLEVKWNGHRVTVRKRGDKVEAWSRTKADGRRLPRELMTDAPAIVKALGMLPDGVYDGELMAPGGMHSDVRRLDRKGELVFVIFDLLELNGIPAIQQTYMDRMDLLNRALMCYVHSPGQSPVLVDSPFYPVSKAAVQAIWDQGGEGAMLKRVSSTYQPGRRSPDWIKVKKQGAAVTTIIGFEAGKNGPHSRVVVRLESGVETKVKTLNSDYLRIFAKDAASYVGRKLVISYTSILASGSPENPMFDHVIY